MMLVTFYFIAALAPFKTTTVLGLLERTRGSSKSNAEKKPHDKRSPSEEALTPAPNSNSRCDFDWKSTRDEYEANLNVWNSFKERYSTGCYNMTVERSCFCAPAWRGPFNVAIRQGEVVFPQGFELDSMNGLFQLVYNECISTCPGSDGPAFCQIEYAPEEEGSYITSIFIDKSYEIADEEIRLSVSNLTFCDTNQDIRCDFDWQLVRDEYEANRQVWNNFSTAASVGCYNMTVERSCFCAPAWRGPFDVIVRQDQVVAPLGFDLNTTNELFDFVFNECVQGCPGSDGPALCQITYAPKEEGSYITSIFIDRSYNMADEEIRLNVSSLVLCE